MLRSAVRTVLLVSATAHIASCTDSGPTGTLPRSAARPGGARTNVAPGTCTTLSNLISLVNTVFGAGSPDANSVLGKLDNLDKQIRNGNLAGAASQAQNIVAFVQQKAAQGGLPGTQAQIDALIGGVLCYAGISPDTFLIYPSDAPQVLVKAGGKSGISLQGNTVTVPTLITITDLPPDVSPLNTKLDVYPGFILISQSSPLTKPAVVGVCPSASVPAAVLARLRLGHQASTGFEITPAADASFIDCSVSVGQSRMSKLLNALASLVTPKPLYAKMNSGGIGGLVSEFSPFGPVDTDLRAGSGIGGTVTEFQVPSRDTTGTPPSGSPPASPRGPREAPSLNRAPGQRVNTVVNGVCTVVDATLGTPLPPECRPVILIKTANGTVLQSVPVGWAIGLGGGVTAPEASDTRTCGTFGSTAATSTDANGKASVCWTLGNTPGTNTVVATPTAGGDAPNGVTFSPATITFSATANQITPTVGATGGTFQYDGLPHAGSGTCSNSLTPSFTYSGNGSVPTDVGTYTLTVTCGAGNPLYKTVSLAAQIQITPATTTTTVTCPASVAFTTLALTPCSATVTGPGLSLTPTPVYSSNVNVGTATASVTYAGGGNYLGSSGSATFQITPAATLASVTCPASVTFTGSAITPCTGLVTGPGLSLALTPTYTSNVVGTATATVNYAGGGNYQPSTASKTFQISYMQSGCFASPIYNVMPSTKSFQNKGSNVPVKCTLLTAQGTGVTNATGDLTVQDLGTNGLATPTTVFSQTNAFKVSGSGNYAYGLATSSSGFVSGHFYLVTALWSDGSKSTGYFYIK